MPISSDGRMGILMVRHLKWSRFAAFMLGKWSLPLRKPHLLPRGHKVLSTPLSMVALLHSVHSRPGRMLTSSPILNFT